MRTFATFAFVSLSAVSLLACGEDTSSAEGQLGEGQTPSGVGGSGGASAGSGGVAPGSGGGGASGAQPLLIVAPEPPPPTAGSGDDACANNDVLEVIYRDFSEDHPDFEMAFAGDQVRIGLVESTLGADKKPVFKDRLGCIRDRQAPTSCDVHQTPSQPVIQDANSYSQWYKTVDGVNHEFVREIRLTNTGVFESSGFFPLNEDEGWGVTPRGNGQRKNFLFTTEIHLTFTYRNGQVFSFRGDDDVWVFVNNKLALDLGSMHGPEVGEIDFDARAAELGIQPGRTYSMDVFHAERHTEGSNFRIETNIECIKPVPLSSIAR